MNNRIVVDLNKVVYAILKYHNQWGQVRMTKPKAGFFTIAGTEYSKTELQFGSKELLFDYAKRRDSLDVWVPVCKLQLQASHSLSYSGKKALSIYKEFCRRQFKRK
jgi:hypothetical protein